MATNRPDLESLCVEFQQTGNEAVRNRIIEHLAPSIRSAAEKLAAKLPKSVDAEDLAQAGVFGLMEAIKSFDPDRGVKLTSFAGHRILGAMWDEIRECDFVPRLARKRSKLVAHARELFETTFGYPPDDDELRRVLKVDEGDFNLIMKDANPTECESVHRRIGYSDALGKEDPTMLDTLVDKKFLPASTIVAARDIIDTVRRTQGEEAATILRLRYMEDMTLKNIGEQYANVTESCVSQRLQNIFSVIRHRKPDGPRRRAA